LAVGENSHHWMFQAQIVDVPAAMQERADRNLYAKRVSCKQRRIEIGRGSAHHYAIEFYARPNALPLEGKISELYLTPERLTGFLLRCLQQVAVEPLATKQQD
jgi:hypothetical protein